MRIFKEPQTLTLPFHLSSGPVRVAPSGRKNRMAILSRFLFVAFFLGTAALAAGQTMSLSLPSDAYVGGQDGTSYPLDAKIVLTPDSDPTQYYSCQVQLSGSAVYGVDYTLSGGPTFSPPDSNGVMTITKPGGWTPDMAAAVIITPTPTATDNATVTVTVLPSGGFTPSAPASQTVTIHQNHVTLTVDQPIIRNCRDTRRRYPQRPNGLSALRSHGICANPGQRHCLDRLLFQSMALGQ